jgi:uncharacterized protein
LSAPEKLTGKADKDGPITFAVRVVPRSSKSEIVGEHDGALKVKLASPPVDGAANDELVKLLAKGFGVPRSAVEIVSGHASKTKTVRVRGAAQDEIAAVLQQKT